MRVPGAAPGPVHWTEALAELHRWATPAMTAGDQVPVFGSRDWCALGDDDPAKAHAKAHAAARAAMARWTEQQATADAVDHVHASHAAAAAAHDWTRQAREHTRHIS